MEQYTVEIPVTEYKALVETAKTLNTIKEAYTSNTVSRYEWGDALALFFGKKSEAANNAE